MEEINTRQQSKVITLKKSITKLFSTGALVIWQVMFGIILSLSYGSASAQNISKGDLLKITGAVNQFRESHPVQKIYLQFDKPYYAVGDTIWFKAYLLNADYLTAAATTGICYVELDNADNNPAKRLMLPVSKGLSWGSIVLNETDIPGGNYTLRAYTSLMCNFGDDYIFKKSFYFFNALLNDRTVNTKISLTKDNGAEQARIHLQFVGLNKEPVVLKNMNLNITDGRKVLFKKPVQTDVGGSLDVALALKSSPKHLALAFNDAGSADASSAMVVPVTFNRPESTDVQFMPEGGNLVAGLPAHIGFKAIGEDGRPVETEGQVFDGSQQPVASFKSSHKGMGAFDMMPQAGVSYTASVTLPGGLKKTYTLPAVKGAGTTLKVRTTPGGDTLAVTIAGTLKGGRYYLVGQARGVVCYAAIVSLANNASKVMIPASVFPTGIARLTLLDDTRQPLNERAVFIDHHDYLHMEMKADKPAYGTGDSVALKLHITNKDGRPVRGSFSISVIDNAQVKTDSINNGTIISNLLLTSDLKGNIDEPGYYFQPDADGQVKLNLDNLLLTQGWVGYNWPDIFAPAKPALYPDERDFNVNGRVINFLGKPVANTHVVLLSRKPSFFLDTLTDRDGRFSFKNMVPLDTPAYILQARNKNGRSFNVDLKIDEFKPPVFTSATENITPLYVNTDSTLVNYAKNNIAIRTEREKNVTAGGHLLKEVVIKSKKIINDSKNLNGSGAADFVIDEKELEKAGKKSFLDLLYERVTGFREGAFAAGTGMKAVTDLYVRLYISDFRIKTESYVDPSLMWYFIGGTPIKLIVDGVSVNQILGVAGFRDVMDYLRSHSAEDVKGIEVMSSPKYASAYLARYNPVDPDSGKDLITEAWDNPGYPVLIGPADVAFVEITTRSGAGPDIVYTPGVYLYKPLPFSLPKQFYSPRYQVPGAAAKDSRSTIYWKPDITTNLLGEAHLSFYTAGKPGDYTIILEGIDGNGALGSGRSKIKVACK